MKEQQTNTAPLLFFEDVMAETQTRRNDWLIGTTGIAEYLERDSSTISALLTRKHLPAIKVKIYGSTKEDGTWILRVTDAQQYKDSHQQSKEIKTTNTANGNGHKTAEVVYLKEGSPLMSTQDMDRLVSTMWRLVEAVKANTEEIKRMRETWEK